MVNDVKMTPLAQVINLLPQLSNSELDQLKAMLSVGTHSSNPAPVKPQKGKTGPPKQKNSAKEVPKSGNASASVKKPKKRGNPARKSMWITNPHYVEYARLKKVVQAQAKSAKIAFNAVATPEQAAYKVAFTQWMQEKQSFRNPNDKGNGKANLDAEESSGSEMEVEEENPHNTRSRSPVKEIIEGLFDDVNVAESSTAPSLKKRVGSAKDRGDSKSRKSDGRSTPTA